MYRATLIYGDGIGPEVIEATKIIIDELVDVEWDVVEVGKKALKKYGNPLPDEVVESIKRNKIALKGPVTTKLGMGGFKSVTVALRKIFDLYANVRPFRSIPTVSPYKNVDIVVCRENTEDLYSGIEFYAGDSLTIELTKYLVEKLGVRIDKDSAVSLKVISIYNTKRISEFAFQYGIKNNRKKITIVHKSNILKATDGLFLEIAKGVAKKYSMYNITVEDKIVDNMALQLIQNPQSYDILLTPNLYGDILSDLCAGLVGGLGLCPGANIGDKYAIFEPIHGSAPNIAGKGIANPTAAILSGAMMLDHLGEKEKAEIIRSAIFLVYTEGKKLTYDIANRVNVSPVSTTEFTKEVIRKIRELI